MTSRLTICLLLALATLVPASGAEPPPGWLFLDFEEGWKVGPFPRRARNIALAQGHARIVEESSTGQSLELRPGSPFTAVLVDASPVATRSVVYCEIRVRPFAIAEDRDEEFLDFGGAVLGFFRIGDEAELCALFGKSETESVWISSGVRVPLDASGASADWMHLSIRLNQTAGRWSLAIDGREVLSGLRTVPRGSALRLWLYGNDTSPARFDDVLIAGVPPDEIRTQGEPETSSPNRTSVTSLEQPRSQVAIRTKANATLRETAEPLQRASGNVHLADWHVTLDTGDRTYESQHASDDAPSIIAYAPPFDENGNRLPITLTITADAQIEPGADLGRIRWKIREVLGWPDKFGATIAEGDFRTGLVQIVTIPGEWTSKATAVHVEMASN